MGGKREVFPVIIHITKIDDIITFYRVETQQQDEAERLWVADTRDLKDANTIAERQKSSINKDLRSEIIRHFKVPF